MNEHRVRMYLRLSLAAKVGAITFGRLVEAFGSVQGFWDAPPSQWAQVHGVGRAKVEAISAVTEEQIDDELSEAQKYGADILCLEDEDYPAALKHIFDPPPVLYVRGKLHSSDAVSLGVVGARRCTHYGQEQAGRFGQLLGRAGFTVVSGGARGIDAAAHRGALAAGGRTIAVMGCGLCTAYPPENAELFEQIVNEDRGAVVSELAMRTAVLGGNFPKRNRIISGLTLGTLVVEAARKSGSLITARIADEQGRSLFALPGQIDSPLSMGTNELIRDGAVLVQNLDDILEQLGELGEHLAIDELPTSPLPRDGLDEIELKILDSIGQEAVSLDDIVRRTEIASGQSAASLTMLLLKGHVEQRAGNMFVVKSYGTGQ